MQKTLEEQHDILVTCRKLENGQFLATAELGFGVGMDGPTEEEAVQKLMDGIRKVFEFMGMGMRAEAMVKLSTGQVTEFPKQERKIDA